MRLFSLTANWPRLSESQKAELFSRAMWSARVERVFEYALPAPLLIGERRLPARSVPALGRRAGD